MAAAGVVHKTFQNIKPATKIQNFLNEVVPHEKQKNIFYKGVNGLLTSARTLLGWGADGLSGGVIGTVYPNPLQYQPILAKKPRNIIKKSKRK